MGGDNVYYGNTDNDRKEDDIDNDETVINRDGENYCDSDDEDDINNQEKNDGSLYIIQTTTASIVAAPAWEHWSRKPLVGSHCRQEEPPSTTAQ